jgi:hypothetical protein
MIQPVLLGGLFIGVLSGLPIVSIVNCCCCGWVIIGGALAAKLSQQERRPLTPGRGALIGFLAGIAGAIVWLIITLALDPLVGPLQQRIIDQVLRSAQDMPPEARDWLENMRGGSGAGLQVAAGFVLHLCASVFAALGGLLGAIFFRRDIPPAIGGDPIAPPPIPPQ